MKQLNKNHIHTQRLNTKMEVLKERSKTKKPKRRRKETEKQNISRTYIRVKYSHCNVNLIYSGRASKE